MRCVLLTAFAVLLTLPLSAADWSTIADKLAKSVVVVETADGLCTGFVIDNERDHVLTANHCDGKELVVDGMPAKVVHKENKKDLLVLKVEDIDRPALKLAKDDPHTGQEVVSFGYGYGLEQPLLRVAHISHNKVYIPEGNLGGPFVFVDSTFVSGMSGGPVINLAGELVMIVQMGTKETGIGIGAEMIRSKVGRYFSKPAEKK
jgi:S1-C subfamily serine protease